MAGRHPCDFAGSSAASDASSRQRARPPRPGWAVGGSIDSTYRVTNHGALHPAISARSSRYVYRGAQHYPASHVHLPVSACRTRAIWQYRSVPSFSGLLPTLTRVPRLGCPQLHRPAATGHWWSPFTSARYDSASWRSKSPIPIPALERIRPALRVLPTTPARATHDYLRSCTINLFTALGVDTGRVHIQQPSRYRRAEFKNVPYSLAPAVPADLEVHLILADSSTYMSPRSTGGYCVTPASRCTSLLNLGIAIHAASEAKLQQFATFCQFRPENYQ
jgi:hypothetical protein